MRPETRSVVSLLAILVAVTVGWVLHIGAAVLQPLVIAFLLAGMLQPIVKALRRWHIPPWATVVALAALLFLGLAQFGLLLRSNLERFLGAPLAVAPPPAAAQPAAPTAVWPRIVEQLASRLRESDLPAPLADLAEDGLRQIDLRSAASGLLGGGFGFLRTLVLVVIYLVFIFAEAAVFRRKILQVAGERSPRAAEALDRIGWGIQRYLGIHTLVSAATGALLYAGLLLIGLPYALLFGLLAFLLNYIPTFGSIIAALFPIATALALEEGVETALLVAALFLAVNLTLGSFLEPRILGRELNLSPLVVLVSVVVWAGIWGVVGAFLAVPLTASLQIFLASMDTTRPVALLLSSGRGAPPAAP